MKLQEFLLAPTFFKNAPISEIEKDLNSESYTINKEGEIITIPEGSNYFIPETFSIISEGETDKDVRLNFILTENLLMYNLLKKGAEYRNDPLVIPMEIISKGTFDLTCYLETLMYNIERHRLIVDKSLFSRNIFEEIKAYSKNENLSENDMWGINILINDYLVPLSKGTVPGFIFCCTEGRYFGVYEYIEEPHFVNDKKISAKMKLALINPRAISMLRTQHVKKP